MLFRPLALALPLVLASLAPVLAAPVPARHRVLRYDDVRVQLDVYDPGKAGSPVAILIHGAGGIEGDREVRYRTFGQSLARNGILAVAVHYFDGPRHRWLRTILMAVSYARTLPNADPRRVGLIGYSLGGTIALRAASLDRRVTLVATVAGYTPDGFSRKDASRLPVTLMISGDRDSAVHTLRTITGWLREMKRLCRWRIYRGQGHSFTHKVWRDAWHEVVRFSKTVFRMQARGTASRSATTATTPTATTTR